MKEENKMALSMLAFLRVTPRQPIKELK